MFCSLTLCCALLAQAEESKAKSEPDAAAAQREAARKQLQEDVTRLINRYVRGDLQQKQQVIQELLDKGPEVLEVLPPLDDTASADRKQLLAAVRPKLEKQMAEAAGKASLISLKGEMLLSEALAALEKQSGNKIVYQPGEDAPDPTVKINVAKVPFWQALDGVMDLRGLTTNLYAEQPGVSIVTRPQGELSQSERRVAYSGPFRLEVTGVESRRSTRTRDNQRMQLGLEVAWEPRLAPISLRLPMANVKALDDQGNAMSVASEGAPQVDPAPGTYGSELTVPIGLPSRDVKKIASLKGTMEVLVPGRTATFKFEKLKRGDSDLTKPLAVQGQSGVQVVLHRAVQNGDVWQIAIVLRFESADGALASHRGWYFNNPTYLLDAKGERIDHNGYELYRRTENEAGIAYSYDLENGPDGMTLVYETPSLIMNLPVSFEIKDIELP
jgi:hypothetical protein